MYMLSMAQYQHLYLYLSENMNSPLNHGFLNQKLKKQKRQCSQNLDLNPTCEIWDICAEDHCISVYLQTNKKMITLERFQKRVKKR